jgi:hypothetical protein
MAMSALLTLVLSLTWKVLVETPFKRKSTLYARFLTSLAVVQEFAIAASLSFAPGLLEVLQASTPPTVAWFKNLPSDNRYAWETDNWAVYLIVLEKDGERTRIYIGSGTNAEAGLAHRWNQYVAKKGALPSGMKKAFEDGFEITHKGVLCWKAMPSQGKALLMYRLLFLCLECAFTYYFWAMKSGTRDDAMSYICPWTPSDLEYDGICSHGSLLDHPQGNFELTDEQYIAQAAEHEAKFRANKALQATNYHYKQMAENYDEYLGNAIDRKMKSRELHPELDMIAQKKREDKYKDEKKFHCTDCDLSFGRQNVLDDHFASDKHARKVKQNAQGSRYSCKLCNIPLAHQASLTRHRKSNTHKEKVAEAKAALAAAKAAVQLSS